MRKNIWKKVIFVLVVLGMMTGIYQTALAEECNNGIYELSEQVNSSDDYVVIEDEFKSAADVKTYDIAIDYSTVDAAAICLVRTGQSYIYLKIEDESGNEIKNVGAAQVQPKRWVFINKPIQDESVVHYTLSVSCGNYIHGSGQFRLIYGDKKYVEAMISGPENATPVEWFTNAKHNFFHNDI